MKTSILAIFLSALTLCFLSPSLHAIQNTALQGASPAVAYPASLPKIFHPIAFTFQGPYTSENNNPNPFRDVRFFIKFVHLASSTEFLVPGHFAADGMAANSHATAGDKWRVIFSPPLTGSYFYTASMETGPDLAIADPDPSQPSVQGSAVPPINGATGFFNVAGLNGNEARGYQQGLLMNFEDLGGNNGFRKYLGNGKDFFKIGAGSPETLLNYPCFDQTTDLGGILSSSYNDFSGHASDWIQGDPTWSSSNPLCQEASPGKNIAGMLNYLASRKINSIYFMTLTLAQPGSSPDGDDVWPWISPNSIDRYDVSKLDQWNIVFNHASKLGIHLTLFTQETENDFLLNNGTLGPERKLYYRELVSRFGHNLGVTWELGEENDNWSGHVKNFGKYLKQLDPYSHEVSIHPWPQDIDSPGIYDPLLGYLFHDGANFQITDYHLGNSAAMDKIYDRVKTWRDLSSAAGRPWEITLDELGPAAEGVKPDSIDPDHDMQRHGMWDVLMAGGQGYSAYFGFNFSFPCNDLHCDNLRDRDGMFLQMKFMRDFLDQAQLPLPDLTPLSSATYLSGYNGKARILGRTGQVYGIYLYDPGTISLNLSGVSGTYSVKWFNPKFGGSLQVGTVPQITGGGIRALGLPPFSGGKDRVILINRI